MQIKTSKSNVLSHGIHNYRYYTAVCWRKNVAYNTSLKWINWQSELPFHTVLINLV